MKYLGSMIALEKPFDAAFRHRAGVAETNYTLIPTLIDGLDFLTLQDKHLKRIDAFYYRFLRRIMGIKASFLSRITNNDVWRRARYSRKPSSFLNNAQSKLLSTVFLTQDQDPVHRVVFSPGFKGRIQSMGRRRGGKLSYWIEVTTYMFYKDFGTST